MRKSTIWISALSAVTFTAGSAGAAAATGPPEPADHGHILLLDVETVPGTNPPLPSSVRKCIDLGNGQAVGNGVRPDDPRHVDYDGGWFTARTGHVVVPTYPYVDPRGVTLPWRNCAEFLAFVGL